MEWRGECAMSGVVPWSKREANEARLGREMREGWEGARGRWHLGR